MEGELKERSVCSQAKRQATLGEVMAAGSCKIKLVFSTYSQLYKLADSL
jgi:hypothetical protein